MAGTAGTVGIAASGHECTSAAAIELLQAGGNAFDGALAALCAATVCEPLLASLGGGGFLMAQTAAGESIVHDFFAQTPRLRRQADEIDFYPIVADFGTATQEFHIGMGSMAVPGMVAGIFDIHRRHCTMDMATIMAPAIRLAREGVEMNRLQNYIAGILQSILKASPEAQRLVATDGLPGEIAPPGAIITHPELADTMQALVSEGEDLFYRGEVAQRLVADCRDHGGMLTLEDLADYQAVVRSPVEVQAQGARFEFNAPPSPGGSLLAFSLSMLEGTRFTAGGWGGERHCRAIASALDAGARLRRETRMDRDLDQDTAQALLETGHLQEWRNLAMPQDLFSRGTTHLSVVDGQGNVASLTATNGEGCAYVIPGTGIMMNNMLGEEDLNPDGFHRWTANQRLASMMCPSIACLPDGGRLALGSGGSNRIRSAVLQVIVNMLGFGMPLHEAVIAPRMHVEAGKLSVESGYPDAGLERLLQDWPDHELWPETNMFFGGVHGAELLGGGGFHGAGDPRRGGVVAQTE